MRVVACHLGRTLSRYENKASQGWLEVLCLVKGCGSRIKRKHKIRQFLCLEQGTREKKPGCMMTLAAYYSMFSRTTRGGGLW